VLAYILFVEARCELHGELLGGGVVRIHSPRSCCLKSVVQPRHRSTCSSEILRLGNDLCTRVCTFSQQGLTSGLEGFGPPNTLCSGARTESDSPCRHSWESRSLRTGHSPALPFFGISHLHSLEPSKPDFNCHGFVTSIVTCGSLSSPQELGRNTRIP